MASPEAQRHIERLIETHEKVIQRLELRKALEGNDTPPHVTMEIEERQLNIAELKRHRDGPKILPATREAVRSYYDDDLDFVITQVAQLNQRQTGTEEQVKGIAATTYDASVWRMQAKEAIDDLVVRFTASEQARTHGAKWYRIAILVLFVLIILHYFGVG